MEVSTIIAFVVLGELLYYFYRTKENPIPPAFQTVNDYDEDETEDRLVEEMQGVFPQKPMSCTYYKPPTHEIQDNEDMDDEELIEKLNEGHLENLSLLFERYKDDESGYTFLANINANLLISKEVTCFIRHYVGEGKIKLFTSHKAYKRIFDSSTYDLEYHDTTLYIHENNQFELSDKMSYSEDRFLD